MKTAATNTRELSRFLLMAQLEAQAIGRRIAQARKEAGMTQEDVADVASFSRRSLQDYEAGTTIPYKHLREISDLLQREVAWFLHGEPAAPEPSPVAPTLDQLLERVEGLEDTLDEIRRLLLEPRSERSSGSRGTRR